MPVIEAMHFGKPVFLSTHTSLPEIGGDAAWYFESFDAEAMQAVYNKGMADYNSADLTPKIIAHANRFDWKETARQYLKLYADCLAGNVK